MMNFLLCVSVDKRKVEKDTKYITEALKSFYCKLNRVRELKKDDLFITTDTDDKVYALLEYKLGFIASVDFDPLLNRDRDADNFYEFALSSDTVTNEDSTIYLCKCFDELFENLLCSKKCIYDAIKVVASDGFGNEFDLKYTRTYSKKCTEDLIKVYEKTIKGFKYELLSESNDVEKLYGFAFDCFVIPFKCEVNRFQLWFSFIRKTLDEDNTDKLHSILMKALVEIFSNESLDLSC